MTEIKPINYSTVLNVLKEKIRQARTHAALFVNSQLLNTYWEIGTTIIQQQEEEGWGSKIIDRLSADLNHEFPDMKGLSIRNIKYMRSFADAYPYFPNVQAPLAQTPDEEKTSSPHSFVQAPLAQISWYHHITLLNKVKDLPVRMFYINKTIENGWSRDVMVHQIESNLYARQGALITNFKSTVPPQQSELLQQIFKDPYNFDFLQWTEEAKERDLENGLIHNITKVLLELGDGFAFIARQYRLEVDGQEYFLDLLFYHTKIRRHIVVELKIGDFMPEFAGKMNFYLGLVDDRLKGKYDEQSIGLILCKTKSKIIAEYALRDTSKPIGIAEYKLIEQMPDDIKGELPSIEELEQKLDEELKDKLNPAEIRLNAIKEKLKKLHTDEIQTPVTYIVLASLYETDLRSIYEHLINKLNEFGELFYHNNYLWNYNNSTIVNLQQLDDLWHNEVELRQLRELCFYFILQGFRKAGTENFNESIQLNFTIDTYWYGFSLVNYNNNQPFLKKLYHQPLTTSDKQLITDTVVNQLLDKVEWILGQKNNNPNT